MIYIKPWYLVITEKKQINDAIDELAEKTLAPMNTMLTKQLQEELLKRGREEMLCNLWTFLQQVQVCETVHKKQYCETFILETSNKIMD